MKRFILFWTFTVLFFMANAQNNAQRNDTDSQREPSTHVTATQAMDVGYAFMHTGNGSKRGGTQSGAVRKQAMQLVYTGRATDSLTRGTSDCYYVFALQPKGFVIVAADNRVEPILGYSYDNNFVVENMPEHVRSWLGDYEKQIQLVNKSDHQAEPDIKTKWSRLKSGQPLSNTRNGVTVGPLLTTTWDQAPYYNALCPEDPNGPDGHVVTGCVATAMAQIINYWGYPAHGRGIHSYNSNYGTLEVDYNNVQYDYANMPDALTSSSTQEQINAVATLMYHCGVATNMIYTADESGTYDFEARAALINFFRFSPNLNYAEKRNFSNVQWNNMLQENIAADIPVMYSGSGSIGGHTFVCDGYNSDNYYHFNFGWSGNNDGWYMISAINPGVYEFNSEQSVLLGIVPDSSNNIILGQLGGASTFTIDEPMEFYHLMGHNAYTGLNYYNNCNNTVEFVSDDTSKQVVIDVMSFENQYVTVYDGNQEDQLAFYSGSSGNYSSVVSTAHALTLLYQGDVNYFGFHLSISQDNGCRMVSNVTSSVDTNTVHLAWHENGNATQWQIEYGLKGFSHGNGTMVTANDATIDIYGLMKFREYDMYIRSVCDTNQTGPWCQAVTVMPEARYWTDVVTSQPEGFVEDSLGNIIISSAEGLAWFSKLAMENSLISLYNGPAMCRVTLVSDINLGQYKWRTIRGFCGEFDGQGHRIDSVSDALLSIIELQRKNVIVKNIYLTCFDKGGLIDGVGSFSEELNTPGLAGVYASGRDTIMNCFVSGKTSETPIATNGCNLFIINCASNCEVVGDGGRGAGIVGDAFNGGPVGVVVRNCYSAGEISVLKRFKGVILGYGEGAVIENCYGYYAHNGDVLFANASRSTLRDNAWFNETDSGFYLFGPLFFEPDSIYYSNLKDVLNAGVRKYNLDGLRLWVDDTAGINEGMPMLGPEYIPTCPNIRDLSARNVVGQDGLCGVKLSWTEVGDATAWEVKYHIQDSTDIVCVLMTNNPDTVWGLTEHATYLFSIRPVCTSSNRGGWSDEFSFVVDRPYWIEVVTSQPDGYTIDAEGNVTISTAEGLAWLISTVNGLNGQPSNDFEGKTVTLMQDVNLGQYKWTAINGFRGTFNGHEHTISSLYINELKDYQGLFGHVYGGKYMNVNIDSADVKGDNGVGILIGVADMIDHAVFVYNPELLDTVNLELSTIVNCHVSGTVQGTSSVGGIAGVGNCEEINACSSSGRVYADYDNAGGLFGKARLWRYDGISGYYDDGGSIRNCFSRCDVTAKRYTAGGLFGYGGGKLENCYAVGNVNGFFYDGGLTGSFGGEMKNCYAGGSVPGVGYVCMNMGGVNPVCGYRKGALIGTRSTAVISNCYGLADFGHHPLVGMSEYEDPVFISDTASFTLVNDSIALLNGVLVGQTYYDNLLAALNAWVDTYDTAGMCLHWIPDTSGVNGGFPMFEEIRYNTMTLMVADSTPYGSVSGEGVYNHIESAIFSAMPDYGYHFVQWNDGNTDNPRVIKLTQDTTFIAIFEKDLFSIVGTAGAGISYSFDFENPARDYIWTLQNGDYVNQWCINTLNDTNRALFISADNGISNYYLIKNNSRNAVCARILLAAGQYDYSYDWNNKSRYGDAMTVALIPVSEQYPSEEWSAYNLPLDAIELGRHSNGEDWTNQSGQIDVPATGEYFFWIFWKNTYCCGGRESAPAIDNIQLKPILTEENYHGYTIGSDTVPYLDTVMLTAIPNEGYYFSCWNDGNTENPRTVMATADKYYIAMFTKCPDTTNIIVHLTENGYDYNGNIYSQPDILTFNYPIAQGCDSVVNLILCDESLQICENHLPYIYGDTTFDIGTVTGLYPITTNGQKSFVYLQVNPIYSVYDTMITCDNWWKFVGNVNFHDSLPGDYQVMLHSSCGCDSLVYLHYVVNPSYRFELYDTIPRGTEYSTGDFYFSTDETQNARQLYQYIWGETSEGCDSIYVLNLALTGAPIIYVTQNGTGDGSSWENAMGDLQAALDLAGQVQGDVWVAEGTYYGDGVSENAFTIPDGVNVYGGFAGNEPGDFDLSLRDFTAHPTVLDGQHLQRTVYAWGGVALIDGFTIQNGYQTYYSNIIGGEVRNCIIQGGLGSDILYGVTIRNSVICYNSGRTILNNCNMFNSTIVNHSTSEFGYIAVGSTMTNCILWNNIGYVLYGTISYSAVDEEQVVWGNSRDGNITIAHDNDGVSPDFNYVRFVDPENGNFRLAYGSACINAGTPDISGLGLPSVDLQGLPRVLDGRVDMGAYEYYPVPVVDVHETICDSGSVTFYGTDYTDAGSYYFHTNSDPLQDTLYVLHLQIGYNYSIDSIIQMPENGYVRDGQTYTLAGVYTFNYTTINGCDSIIRITLYDTLITLCGNHLPITYGETTFAAGTVSGLYPVMFNGQELLVYLQINPVDFVYDTITTCSNSLVFVGNVCLRDSLPGDYQFVFQNSCGCDSIVNIHYVVNPSYWFDLFDTIPRGTEYMANDFTIYAYETQDVRQLERYKWRSTSRGCDSTLALHLTLTGAGQVFYVKQNGTGDGSSWENAMGDLQVAMNLAATVQGDVWVAEGTYYGDGVSENAFTIPKGVCVYGGFVGNEPVDYDLSLRDFRAHPTILDGHHVQRTVYCESSWSNVASVLDGFTIQNGYGSFGGNVSDNSNRKLLVNNCVVQTGESRFEGGGLAFTTITNSIIVNNMANGGDALYSCSAYNCVITDNNGFSTIRNSTLTNCIIWNNSGYPMLNCNITFSAVEGQEVLGEGNIILAHNNDGISPDSNYVRFVNPENGDFRLTHRSACINAGIPDISGLGLPSVDLQGLPRVLDGRVDMGAYEYYPIPVVEINDTICEGGTLAFFDSICAVEGQYLHHTSTDVTQDTLHILNLTINHATNLSFMVGTCDWYRWNDSTYRTSGTYTYTHEDANGCTQVDTLHLTINPTYNVTDAKTICASELPYTWNGVEFTQAGTQTATLQTVNGCDSVVTITLIVNTSTERDTTATVCDSFDWYGMHLVQSGDYTHTLTNVAGCDSVVTLHLTVNTPTEGDTTATVCDSFDWYGMHLTQSGDYHHTLTTAVGCDSVITLHLTVNNTPQTPVLTVDNTTICNGGMLSLTITNPMDNVIYTWYRNGVVIPGANYSIFTDIPTTIDGETANYTYNVIATYFNSGCYSNSSDLTITVNDIPETPAVAVDNATVFDGGQVTLSVINPIDGALYTWYRNSEIVLGATQATFVDNLTVIDGEITNYVYNVVAELYNSGCVSNISASTVVTANPIPEVNVTVDGSTMLCEGGFTTLHVDVVPYNDLGYSYQWYEDGMLIPGAISADYVVAEPARTSPYNFVVMVSTMTSGFNITANAPAITVVPLPAVAITRAAGYDESVCEGGATVIQADVIGGYGDISYQWFKNDYILDDETNQTLAINNLIYGENDTYTVAVSQTGSGCSNSASADISMVVSVYPSNTVAVSAPNDMCEGGTLTMIAMVNNVIPGDVLSYQWHEIMSGQDVMIDGANSITYTVTDLQSGNLYEYYVVVNSSLSGCTATSSTHVVDVKAMSHTDLYETTCEDYVWNDTTYYESGEYTQIFTNKGGCDSVVTLHLTINTPVDESVEATACESYIWNDSVYTESGNYTQIFPAANGCDSVVTLHLTINTPVAESVEVVSCESYIWNDSVYTESGNYTQIFPAANGCDSVVTLHLTINTPVAESVEATACDSYTWNGVTYTESGDYTQTFPAANGCDSVVTLHLTINTPVAESVEATACESYIWNDSVYTESGNYTQIFPAANGCDSVVTLHLTINTPVAESVEATSCDSYSWNGMTYTESGDYTQTFPAANGCDSVVTLHLTINTPVAESVEATACDSYSWNGVTYTESGDYTQTFPAANGCDSVVTLHLTVNPSVNIEAYLTISENDLPFTYGDTTFMPGTVQSGDYIFNFTTADGCDSVIILHLTVETGINDYALNASMKVYPNPTKDVVNVQLTINNEQLDDVEIQLFDVYGRLLDVVNMADARGASLQTTQIDLSRYAKGVYFVKAASEGKVIAVRKVVKR